MNGVPVYPVPQNGERPYPEAPKWTFWDPCLGLFPPVFLFNYQDPTRLHYRLTTLCLLFLFFNNLFYLKLPG